ncbi:heterokaryon incompatibility protein-domain-containing protein [Schizothecium vesticola]|uniref:Heterokaryon incompatibility protein-domain-containing protein n=1 Tax=Schizothecium vesticola TaxID=314040 RepID=A0AA40F4T5_9PEZI|nr:heterokaryon incompatibility protein-domain-containing protein [Schizothecium vesticola]
MTSPSSSGSFVYEPLDPLRDCTRLIEIEHCTNAMGPDLRCHVKQVLFSDRPKYRALSYMWGDETARFPIHLNGKWFTVAENLFRALGFLRREKFAGPFWIDAICINQDDIQEKNRQIRIMPHIYFCASAVLVWLGLYPEAEIVEESKRMGDPILGSFLTYASTVEKATRRLLRDCGYWKRLWIIQEIGKAASIEVCYATSLPDTGYPGGVQYRDRSLHWDAFIGKIRGPDRKRGRTGALRMNDQLKWKDKGSHTLRSLLEAHHDALCKNPRDKVYGLAGLAEDCYGFPVDYAKSLFEVWADTLQFLQDGGHVKDEADLLDLAAILMNALGGPSQVMPPPGTSCSVELELRGLLPVGTMAKIGPTTDDMMVSSESGTTGRPASIGAADTRRSRTRA